MESTKRAIYCKGGGSAVEPIITKAVAGAREDGYSPSEVAAIDSELHAAAQREFGDRKLWEDRTRDACPYELDE